MGDPSSPPRQISPKKEVQIKVKEKISYFKISEWFQFSDANAEDTSVCVKETDVALGYCCFSNQIYFFIPLYWY